MRTREFYKLITEIHIFFPPEEFARPIFMIRIFFHSICNAFISRSLTPRLRDFVLSLVS